MEKLKADFAQLQTEVAKMRLELDDVDKFFAVYQSLKKNVDDKLQLVVNKVNELSTAFDGLKSQTVKQQVSMKKDIVGTQKELEEVKKEVKDVKEGRVGDAAKQHSTQKEMSKILKEIEQMNAELKAVTTWQNKAENPNDQIEEITKRILGQLTTETNSKLSFDENELSNLNARVEEMSNNMATLDGMVNQLKVDLDQNRNEQRARQPPSSNDVGKFYSAVPEWVLRERKRNNVIIFGLPEVGNDVVLIHSLFQDLESPCNAEDIRGIYRVGKQSDDKKRPVVIRFVHGGIKNGILSLANQLKWNQKWKGVVITHDLTKNEYLEEKQRETQLKKDAEERNDRLTESEKKSSQWKVIGGRGRRHIALLPIRM